MKITYLHQYFNTPDMSGGTRSFEMARRLVDMGHEVTMVTSSRQSQSDGGWSKTEEHGICVYWLPVPYSNNMSYFARIRAFFKFATASALKAARLPADVVFATSTPLTIALPGVFAALRQSVPMVFEVRDLWPELPIAIGALNNPVLQKSARSLESWAYRHSAAVVALSPEMKTGVVATGYPEQRVAVIPNSCDNSEFVHDATAGQDFRDSRPWLGSRPLLIYAGTFGKINGVAYMVQLAVALSEMGSDLRILLVGEGAEKEVVVDQAKLAGVLGVNLFVEAAAPKRSMPALFSAATMVSSLFIDLPEMRANSANKFFDALAAGKPVYLNYGGWMHQIVSGAECGLAMWNTGIEDAARQLHAAAHNSEWLARAGRESRRLAEELFDRDCLARQLEQVLQAACSGNPESASTIASGKY